MKKKTALVPLPLMRFIPQITRRYHEPQHLAPFVDLLERATREAVRGLVSVPPRHEKSDTTDHAIARMLRANPELRVGFVTYSARAADKRGWRIRELYKRAGGKVAEAQSTKANWRTGAADGGLWCTSIGGPITGEGFDVIVIDDPVKDRVTVESALARDRMWDWFTDVLYTRLEPGGSIIVIMARWHADDLIGRLTGGDWEIVNLPAIDAEGRALLPARYPLTELEKIRDTIGPYGWNSLYLGRPFAKGGAVFQNVYHYDVEPTGPMKIRIGVDLAYSTKARSDYSVAVIVGEVGGTFYVLDVHRLQVTADEFVRRLLGLQARHGGARITGFFSGTEKGTLDMARALGLAVIAFPAVADKFTRAQPSAAAWNAGKILLPRSAPWLDAFVSEIVSFTGVGDRHDDQVDAIAGALAGMGSRALRVQSADQNPYQHRKYWRAREARGYQGNSSVAGSGVVIRQTDGIVGDEWSPANPYRGW